MKALAVTLTFAALLSACASAPPTVSYIAPQQAVMQAAEAAPSGVIGVFDLKVKSTGDENHTVFLNSENDYRDQRNLCIAISPDTVAALAQRYGTSPQIALQGKHILVKGVASRVTIRFRNSYGGPSDKYYYQTHVDVTEPGQITLVE